MNFLSQIRSILVATACLNMVASPLALAAPAQRSNLPAVKEFLKTSGMNKTGLTMADFYKNLIPLLSKEQRRQYDYYAVVFREQKVPIADPVVFRDAQKIEQVRINIPINGKTFSLSTEGYGPTFKVKINSLVLTPNDFASSTKSINRIAGEAGISKRTASKKVSLTDQKVFPTKEEWKKLNPIQRAQYLVLARYVIEHATDVKNAVAASAANSASEYSNYAMIWQWLIPEACAAGKGVRAEGEKCIIAGWVSKYGPRESCAGIESGRKHFEETIRDSYPGANLSGRCGEGFPCNPLIYGFKGNSQDPYCVNEKKVRLATEKECNVQSPLRNKGDERENILRLIKSQQPGLEKVNLTQKNEKGEWEVDASAAEWDVIEKYMKDVNSYVTSALQLCDASDVTVSPKHTVSKGTALYDIPDQASACNGLGERFLQLQLAKKPVPPAPVTPEQGAEQIPSCGDRPADATCPGLPPIVGGPVAPPPLPPQSPPAQDAAKTPSSFDKAVSASDETGKEEKSGSFCTDEDGKLKTICGGALLGLFVAGGIYLISRTNAGSVKNPTYDPLHPYVPPVNPGTVTSSTVNPNPPAQPPAPRENPNPIPTPAPTPAAGGGR